MVESLGAPAGALARELTPFQDVLAPYAWGGLAVFGLGAAVLFWRGRAAPGGLCLIVAMLAAAVGFNIAHDQQVGWEEDHWQRVAALPAEDLVTYIPVPARIRLAACGNDNLAADALWFRSLFFIYQTSDARGSGEMIYHMHDSMAALNPTWKEPQLIGPVLVSALSGETRDLQDNRIQLAERLLHRSQKTFPRDFRFYDLEADLHWSAAPDKATEQAHARALVGLYQQIFDRYDPIYALHPEENPYLDLVPRSLKREIQTVAAGFWTARLGSMPADAEAEDARDAALTPADHAAAAAFWQQFHQTGSHGAVAAFDFAAAQWQQYRQTRADLRNHVLMSLDSPDYRNELFARAGAYCGTLVAQLSSPLLSDQERPEKLLAFYRWDDVYRRTGYEIEVVNFQAAQERLPTAAEFRVLAWNFHRAHGEKELGPPAVEPPGPPMPHDPFGWAYEYESGKDGQSFAVQSRFEAVYKTDLKASRLLTMMELAADAFGRPVQSLGEVRQYLQAKYPPGAAVPPPVLESFGEARDSEASPCGGTFALQDGRLYAPADVQTWWAVRKQLNKQTFDAIFEMTRPYAKMDTPSDPAGRKAYP